MITKKIVSILFLLFSSLTFTACTTEPDPANGSEYSANATDYSKPAQWLSVPAAINKEVDVFYLYPTAWQKVNANEPDICKIDNPLMVKYSKLALLRQATAFETIANIYAPYYRQADMGAVFPLSLEGRRQVIGGIPTSDAVAAFDFYIRHLNNGRPFILAAHSQGSDVMLNILSGYMKINPQVYARMIAAYVIGCSVTEGYLAQNPHLKFAEGPDDTGVIISYNTEDPNVVDGTNPVRLPGAIAINPITWTRDETLAEASQNLGSLVLNKDGSVAEGLVTPVMNYADARVDKTKGVVICTTADVNKLAPGNPFFGRGVYHSFDFPFYYYNIRENAVNRTNNFLNK